ncbi:MAG: PIN domain-containing protein [Candidatus Sumerlaeota bacterium]|nr:PIN domain-containing protein [Candidatus Sumerlaeota bacterium]
MRAYLDADVLIWHLRRAPRALDFFERLRSEQRYELWTGAMQRAEVLFFTKPDEERATLPFMSQLRTAPVDQRIVDKAAVLFRRWRSSHGIGINDALLAATAMETGGRIFTLNVKRYPMPDVLVESAW